MAPTTALIESTNALIEPTNALIATTNGLFAAPEDWSEGVRQRTPFRGVWGGWYGARTFHTGAVHMAKFDGVIQSGLKALSLVELHSEALTKRLPAGHGEYLKDRLAQLGAAIPTQKAVRQQAKQSSTAQLQSMTELRLLLTAIRDAVKHDADATTQDKKEYGLGQRMDPKNTKSLLAAAQTVLKVARAKPDRAQTLSILPEDITQLDALYQAASAADSEEDEKRAAAPLSTKARNALTANVTDAVKKIAGAGILAFAMDEGVRADFESLLGGPSRSAKPTPAQPQ